MESKKTKLWIIIGIILLVLIAILGLGVYFGYIKPKVKEETKPISPVNKTDYFPGNNIQNIGNKTGFITNNWGMISNDEFINYGNYKIDINKAILDIQKDKFYLSSNSISDHSLVGFDIQSNNDIARIGHLNALNFSLLDDKNNATLKDWNNPSFKYTTNLLHAYFIAKTISFFNMDIIGLTEINKDTPIKNAQNFLSLLNSMSDVNNSYDFVMSDNLKGKTSSPGQIEKVIIFYNTKKFNLVNKSIIDLTYPNQLYQFDKTSSKWTISPNQDPQPMDISVYYDFVRPPFSGVFESIDKTIKITPIFSHNDSPGKSGNEITHNGIGAKEFFEANQIQNVLNYYENKFKDFLPVYLGDTNIKLNKQSTAFSTIDTNRYSFVFEDQKEFSSSLAASKTAKTQLDNLFALNKTISNQQDIEKNKPKYLEIFNKLYANPYDKIIYNNKINVTKFNDKTQIITYNNLDLSNDFIMLINKVYFINNNLLFFYKEFN